MLVLVVIVELFFCRMIFCEVLIVGWIWLIGGVFFKECELRLYRMYEYG